MPTVEIPSFWRPSLSLPLCKSVSPSSRMSFALWQTDVTLSQRSTGHLPLSLSALSRENKTRKRLILVERHLFLKPDDVLPLLSVIVVFSYNNLFEILSPRRPTVTTPRFAAALIEKNKQHCHTSPNLENRALDSTLLTIQYEFLRQTRLVEE